MILPDVWLFLPVNAWCWGYYSLFVLLLEANFPKLHYESVVPEKSGIYCFSIHISIHFSIHISHKDFHWIASFTTMLIVVDIALNSDPYRNKINENSIEDMKHVALAGVQMIYVKIIVAFCALICEIIMGSNILVLQACKENALRKTRHIWFENVHLILYCVVQWQCSCS